MTMLNMLSHLATWSIEFFSGLALYCLACLGCGLVCLGCGLSTFTTGSGLSDKQPGYFVSAIFFLFGLGALAQLWTLLALAGLMRMELVGPVVVAMAIVAVLRAAGRAALLRRRVTMLLSALSNERCGIRLLAIAVAPWMAFGLISFGRPMSGDSLALHMLIPKMVAASGALDTQWFQSANEFYGLLGEMSYAALMLLANDDAAQVFTWIASLAGAMVLVGICDRAGLGLRGKVFALAMMFSSTAVLAWIGEGKIELFASSLGLAGISLLVPFRSGAPIARRDLVVAGLLVGFAITCKLILGLCLAIMAAILLGWKLSVEVFDSVRARSSLGGALVVATLISAWIFGSFLLLGIVPHLVKNGVLLGMPFAPLTFGAQQRQLFVDERWYGPETVAHIRLLYPFVLTFGEYFAQYGQLSAMVLGCLPLALFLRRPERLALSSLTAISVAAFAAVAIWAAIYGDKVVTRYFLPALLLCIPLAARAAERATDRSFRPRYLSIAVISFAFAVLSMSVSFSMHVYFDASKALKVMLGTASPCERAWDWCRPMNAVNQAAPKGARVLTVSTYKYYLRPDLAQCTHDLASAFFGSSTLERWQSFYASGYSIILPDYIGNPASLQEDLANPPDWVILRRDAPNDPLGPIWVSYDLTKPGSPQRPPDVTCKNIRGNYWRPVRTGAQ